MDTVGTNVFVLVIHEVSINQGLVVNHPDRHERSVTEQEYRQLLTVDLRFTTFTALEVVC